MISEIALATMASLSYTIIPPAALWHDECIFPGW